MMNILFLVKFYCMLCEDSGGSDDFSHLRLNVSLCRFLNVQVVFGQVCLFAVRTQDISGGGWMDGW